MTEAGGSPASFYGMTMKRFFLIFAVVGVTLGCTKTADKKELDLQAEKAVSIDVNSIDGSASPRLGRATTDNRSTQPDFSNSMHGVSVTSTQLEGKIVQGQSLAADRVESLLTAKNFEQSFLDFEREAGRTTEAQDLTSLYRKLIGMQLGQAAQLERLACGETLCLGSIRTQGSNRAYTQWSDRFFQAPETPNYAFTDYGVNLGGGTTENRFVFSTDRMVNSARFP